MSFRDQMEELQTAILEEDLLKMEILSKKGICFDIPIEFFNFKSALHFATLKNKKNIIHFIMGKNVNLNYDFCGNTAVHYSLDVQCLKLFNFWKPIANICDKFGIPILAHFVTLGFLDHVKWLLDNGANVNQRTSNGQSIAHLSLLQENVGILFHCVQKGANYTVRDFESK